MVIQRGSETDHYRNLATLHPDLHPDVAAIADFHDKYKAMRGRIGLDSLRPEQTIDCSRVDSYLTAIEKARDPSYKYALMLSITSNDAVLAHRSYCPTGRHLASSNMHLFASNLPTILASEIFPLL